MAEILNVQVDIEILDTQWSVFNPDVSKILLTSLDPLVDSSALSPSDSFTSD